MGAQRKPLEQRDEKKGGTVRMGRNGVTGHFAVSVRPNIAPRYEAETVERIKALREAAASEEAMDGEEYLRWLNSCSSHGDTFRISHGESQDNR